MAFGWAGEGRLIWEGYLDTSAIMADQSITTKDMVLRLDVYVGERDLFGIGFSDNVIFRKQYYVRPFSGNPLRCIGTLTNASRRPLFSPSIRTK